MFSILDDTIAIESLPQVFTVAALEPSSGNTECSNEPNYANVYNYLSSVMRGTTSIPQLAANDAAIVLELLEDLIHTLSRSETLIQRQFMHERYGEIRKYLTNNNEASKANQNIINGSTNPFGIPFDVLDFKLGNADETWLRENTKNLAASANILGLS